MKRNKSLTINVHLSTKKT